MLLAAVGTDAWASPGSVYTINCAACSTTADFVTAARQQAWNWSDGIRVCTSPPPLYTGLYIVASQASPLTALINVKGHTQSTPWQGRECVWGLSITYIAAVKMDGTPVTSDADLVLTEKRLFAQSRSPSPISKPINIDPTYGGSYINNSALAEDTSSAISNVLYVQRGLNPNSVPVGTVVQVRWADGTKAKFVKITVVGSIQWAYVPGTATDKDGHPIDGSGNIVPNPNPSTATPNGAPDSLGTFPSNSGVFIDVQPAPNEGFITITQPDGTPFPDTVYTPPGG